MIPILVDVKAQDNPFAGIDAAKAILADKPDSSSCWSRVTKASGPTRGPNRSA